METASEDTFPGKASLSPRTSVALGAAYGIFLTSFARSVVNSGGIITRFWEPLVLSSGLPKPASALSDRETQNSTCV